MVKSFGESSGIGYYPHVVAEPYGGFWSSHPPGKTSKFNPETALLLVSLVLVAWGTQTTGENAHKLLLDVSNIQSDWLLYQTGFMSQLP